MFRDATIRLTTIYFVILFVIVAFFSFNLYRVATNELDRGLNRQRTSLENSFSPGKPGQAQLSDIKNQQLEESQKNIRQEIIMVDIIILLSGGLGSYYLAKRTLKPIRESHEAQSRFVGDASHELRTPISVMKTETEVALRSKSLSSSAKKQLTSNLEEINNLQNLSEALLQLAKFDSNEDPISIESVRSSKLASAAFRRVNSLAKASKITINQDFEDVLIEADPIAIESVLVILLDNALKYSPKGSKIDLRGYVSHNEYNIEVSDEGIGVRPSDQNRIFERFYRADQSRSKKVVDGNGLGLSIAKEILDKHRSSLSVDSKVGKGSTFKFSLLVSQNGK